MHGGKFVRGVLVLVLGHVPPAAGAAQLPRVVAVAGRVLVLVLGRSTIVEVRGVALYAELGVELIISVVLVVLHAGDDPQVRGSEGSQRGQVISDVASVR